MDFILNHESIITKKTRYLFLIRQVNCLITHEIVHISNSLPTSSVLQNTSTEALIKTEHKIYPILKHNL